MSHEILYKIYIFFVSLYTLDFIVIDNQSMKNELGVTCGGLQAI